MAYSLACSTLALCAFDNSTHRNTCAHSAEAAHIALRVMLCGMAERARVRRTADMNGPARQHGTEHTHAHLHAMSSANHLSAFRHTHTHTHTHAMDMSRMSPADQKAMQANMERRQVPRALFCAVADS